MKITSADYYTSALTLDACPAGDLPEFALIGRSNVGKSSLLNLLAGKKELARVSAKPGHTQMINFFTINKTWRLVDLPGYGFAKVAKKQRHQFNEFVSDFLVNRGSLRCVFLLIDGSIPPQPLDLQFAQWLISVGVPFVLVFTKIDKVG
jgi:GTP-binding protein